ncbi:hypothetical protein [Paracoccus binzhouensis]|uniref:hypothetical protein n=1 Tax=Paracoccus binzhouensis TaxID=2796149 RepID=UPI0018EEDD03|nr:hypothetical protein [Paracoccus binzhouensis]
MPAGPLPGLPILAAALALLLLLALRLRSEAARRRTARAGYFDRIAPRMRGLRRAVAPTGFARLSGRIRGVETDLQAVPDMLACRKLPALWLLVTQPAALPVAQRIHLMARPRGLEPFSIFATLPWQTRLPEGFPDDAVLRSEAPLSAAEAALLARHRAILADARVKELVISPRGLRIAWLAEEAERSRYLLFREAELGRTPLPPEVLAPLLAALQRLRADILARTGSEARAGAKGLDVTGPDMAGPGAAMGAERPDLDAERYA